MKFCRVLLDYDLGFPDFFPCRILGSESTISSCNLVTWYHDDYSLGNSPYLYCNCISTAVDHTLIHPPLGTISYSKDKGVLQVYLSLQLPRRCWQYRSLLITTDILWNDTDLKVLTEDLGWENARMSRSASLTYIYQLSGS